jgi:anti-anti-sigma factor
MSPSPAEDATTGLRFETHREGDVAVIQCFGRLTIENADTLKTYGKDLIPQSKRIVLDLKGISRMDSTGLGAVVGLYVSARKAGRDFLLINCNNSVRELLQVTHLLSVLCAEAK